MIDEECVNIPQDIAAAIRHRDISFLKPYRARVDHGCVNVLEKHIQPPVDSLDRIAHIQPPADSLDPIAHIQPPADSLDPIAHIQPPADSLGRIAQALSNFVNNQPTGNNMPLLRNLPLAAAIYFTASFELPVQLDATTPTQEAFFSHQLWAPLLMAAVGETQLRCNWEVQCRKGHENNKGMMLADFGAYMVINGRPYYTLLAELERGTTDATVHKDFVVLAAEMRLVLEKNARQVIKDDIDNLRLYGLLLTQTSAKLLVMRACYDEGMDEISFSLKEDVAKFDFDSTRPPQKLIEDIIDFFSLVMMAALPDGTGISQELFDKEGQRIRRKYLAVFVLVGLEYVPVSNVLKPSEYAFPKPPEDSEVARTGKDFTPKKQRTNERRFEGFGLATRGGMHQGLVDRICSARQLTLHSKANLVLFACVF